MTDSDIVEQNLFCSLVGSCVTIAKNLDADLTIVKRIVVMKCLECKEYYPQVTSFDQQISG